MCESVPEGVPESVWATVRRRSRVDLDGGSCDRSHSRPHLHLPGGIFAKSFQKAKPWNLRQRGLRLTSVKWEREGAGEAAIGGVRHKRGVNSRRRQEHTRIVLEDFTSTSSSYLEVHWYQLTNSSTLCSRRHHPLFTHVCGIFCRNSCATLMGVDLQSQSASLFDRFPATLLLHFLLG